MRLKKGDKVYILKGKNRGKTSVIVRALPQISKVVVEGVSLCKKHVKPKKQGQKGQRVELPTPISSANVALVCNSCLKPTRVGYRLEGGRKIRFCKKCKTIAQ
ncbi:MAG: 50S ribosomal protein L24 [Parcubacteria group bacterium GW2011_GWA2_39_18]|nr:MAG: 50S ribosomal protein L24 [Parcubacteria group bacterium GW2011_GWA2_39_18]